MREDLMSLEEEIDILVRVWDDHAKTTKELNWWATLMAIQIAYSVGDDLVDKLPGGYWVKRYEHWGKNACCYLTRLQDGVIRYWINGRQYPGDYVKVGDETIRIPECERAGSLL
jgi:hypothetical protein